MISDLYTRLRQRMPTTGIQVMLSVKRSKFVCLYGLCVPLVLRVHANEINCNKQTKVLHHWLICLFISVINSL